MTAKSKTLHALRTDDEIAMSIRHALKLDHDVPDEQIKVLVHDGVATLEGDVENDMQRQTAETDARHVRGVRDVINRLEL
jgi:osmotically-inducible protein OsmY